MFITFEGGEGAGKSTQARLLAQSLQRAGLTVTLTREPGGAPGAEALRAILLSGDHDWAASTETYLHFAARAEHLDRTILPALRRGEVVISDRFADSTMAYQGWGLDADRGLIAALTRLLPVQPDLTIMLQTSHAIAAQRVEARHRALDRYEAMDTGFHARVAAGFAAIAAAEPGRCVVVTTEDAIDDVHRTIAAVVKKHLFASSQDGTA